MLFRSQPGGLVIKIPSNKENFHKAHAYGSITMEIKTPVSATLSPEQLAAIQDAVSHYKAVKGGVMPALHAVQGICGNWLPLEALKLLAEGLDIPYPYLYGVMSFYTMFSPTPRGKYIIRLCESPPCHIMGAEDLVAVLKAELGIKVGETTDRKSVV